MQRPSRFHSEHPYTLDSGSMPFFHNYANQNVVVDVVVSNAKGFSLRLSNIVGSGSEVKSDTWMHSSYVSPDAVLGLDGPKGHGKKNITLWIVGVRPQ